MIPEATYKARGCKPLLETNTEKGDDKFVVTMRILGPTQEGQQIDWNGTLIGDGAKYTIAALEIMGFDGESNESVMRNEVEIVVTHREWEGKTYAQVKYVNDPNRSARYTDLTDAQRAAAKARLRAAMKAVSRSQPKQAEEVKW